MVPALSMQIVQNAPADRGTLVQHFAHRWQQVAGCEQIAASLVGNSWESARSRAIAGSERRVTTALRSGSDAADVIGFPPVLAARSARLLFSQLFAQ